MGLYNEYVVWFSDGNNINIFCMKEFFINLLTKLPKNVLAIAVIALAVIVGKVWYGNYMEEQDKQQQLQQQSKEDIEAVKTLIVTGFRRSDSSLNKFEEIQTIEHRNINSQLDIIKRAQSKNVQQQLDYNKEMFNEWLQEEKTSNDESSIPEKIDYSTFVLSEPQVPGIEVRKPIKKK